MYLTFRFWQYTRRSGWVNVWNLNQTATNWGARTEPEATACHENSVWGESNSAGHKNQRDGGGER